MIDPSTTIELTVLVRRKQPDLPHYVEIPSQALGPLALPGPTAVGVRIDGHDLGRRTLKPWGKGRDVWFMNLTAAQCRKAELTAGARVRLEILPVSQGPPAEIQQLLGAHAEARQRWSTLSDYERRQLGEHVRAAVQEATRERRARKGLGLGSLDP